MTIGQKGGILWDVSKFKVQISKFKVKAVLDQVKLGCGKLEQ